MLCTIDVGNTSCKLCLYQNRKRQSYQRIATHSLSFSEEVSSFLEKEEEKIEAIWISCVVSEKKKLIQELCQKIKIKKENIHFLNHQDDLGISLVTVNPQEIGSDLLSLTSYAYACTKKATVILSFGTATVFCYVNQKGEFRYALISPGYQSFEKILFQNTDLKDEQSLCYQETLLVNDTYHALSAGIVNGYTWMVKGLLQDFLSQLPEKEIVVMGCGGQGKKFIPHLPEIQNFEADMVSDGLAYLYQRREKNENDFG